MSPVGANHLSLRKKIETNVSARILDEESSHDNEVINGGEKN